MQTTVSNGQNIINILFDGFAGCLIIKRAIVVNWPDCHGSIGEYFAVSSMPSVERYELTQVINEVLISGSDEQVYASIVKFLNLFSDGKYEINIYTINHGTYRFHHQEYPIIDTIKGETKIFSGHIYPYGNDCFYTKPIQHLSKDRVNYYINLIKNGARPKIIIYSKDDRKKGIYNTPYVLDGHHKLEAYRFLGVDFSVVRISQSIISEKQTHELLSFALPILNSFEFEHLLVNQVNLGDVDFYSDNILTSILDSILQKNIVFSTPVMKLFQQCINSSDHHRVSWINKRVDKLSENEQIGKGLTLYYKGFYEEYSSEGWFPIAINEKNDIDTWIKKIMHPQSHESGE